MKIAPDMVTSWPSPANAATSAGSTRLDLDHPARIHPSYIRARGGEYPDRFLIENTGMLERRNERGAWPVKLPEFECRQRDRWQGPIPHHCPSHNRFCSPLLCRSRIVEQVSLSVRHDRARVPDILDRAEATGRASREASGFGSSERSGHCHCEQADGNHGNNQRCDRVCYRHRLRWLRRLRRGPPTSRSSSTTLGYAENSGCT